MESGPRTQRLFLLEVQLRPLGPIRQKLSLTWSQIGKPDLWALLTHGDLKSALLGPFRSGFFHKLGLISVKFVRKFVNFSLKKVGLYLISA